MKSNLLFGVFLLALTGCHHESKRNSSTVVQQQSTEVAKTFTELSKPKSNVSINENFKLTQTYQGDNLTLIYPHARNFGWWKLQGDDAKVLYESLEIEPLTTEGGTNWLPSKIKNTSRVSCYKQSLRSQPKNFIYSCSLFIDYRSGNVVQANTGYDLGKPSPSNKDLSDYQGTYLSINAQEETATVSVTGDDAKALYYSMNLFEGGIQTGFGDYKRKANMIDCRLGMDNGKDACYIRINVRNGELEFPAE